MPKEEVSKSFERFVVGMVVLGEKVFLTVCDEEVFDFKQVSIYKQLLFLIYFFSVVELFLHDLEKRHENVGQNIYLLRDILRQCLDLAGYKGMVNDLSGDPLLEICFVQVVPVFMGTRFEFQSFAYSTVNLPGLQLPNPANPLEYLLLFAGLSKKQHSSIIYNPFQSFCDELLLLLVQPILSLVFYQV